MSSWQMLILNLYFTIINCHAEVTYPSNLEKCQKSHLKSTVFISALWSVELYTVFYFPEGIAGNKTKADLWHWWNRRTVPGVRGLPEDTPTQAMLGTGHGPRHLSAQHLQSCSSGPGWCYFS